MELSSAFADRADSPENKGDFACEKLFQPAGTAVAK
jgi:hypothetical protein